MNYIKNNPNIIDENRLHFKCILQCPFERNDSINSIDIYNNKIIYGTLMGDVYLCNIEDELNNFQNRTIENYNIYKAFKTSSNIFNNKNKIEKNINNEENFEKYLNRKENNEGNIYTDINIDNNDFNYNNSIKVKKIKKNEEFNSRNFLRLNNQSKPRINYLDYSKENSSYNYSITKLKNKNSLTGSKLIINQQCNNKNITFPKIVKILKKERENINCLSFVNSNIINISIGDVDIVHLENINKIYDNESSYIYKRINNYETENKHILYCENCICFLNLYHYLMVYTQQVEFNSKIVIKDIKYINKNLVDYSIVEGEIQASNFCIPFDFDGDKFLYVDFFMDQTKSINIYYTLTKKENYKFKISNDFGHISHMKLLPNNHIFLCRKNAICEIYKYIINDINNIELFFVNSWLNNKEIISSNIYIFGSKIDNESEDNRNISDDSVQYVKKEEININDSINSKNKIIDINHKNENIKRYNKIPLKEMGISNDLYQIDNLLVGKKELDKNNNYCIITLDEDGVFHLYCNNNNITLFNLYEIVNFDDKEKELFTTGFPYYITMNEIYFVISTDLGVFVISKN